MGTGPRAGQVSPEDKQALQRAYDLLEYPNLAVQLGNIVGVPLETIGKIVPATWRRAIDDASHAVIERLLQGAIRSLDPAVFAPATPTRQRFLCAMSGAAGGTFGLPGVLIELPVTTTLMLRTIAATAAAHGEDLDRMENRVACLQVLAFGGPTHRDDAAETGYYGVRLALGHHFSLVSERVAEAAGFAGGVPGAIELVQGVAARFGLTISQKVALQLTPVIGAASGAAVNMAFMTHFQRVSEGHFIIRALERRHGIEPVQSAYEALKAIGRENDVLIVSVDGGCPGVDNVKAEHHRFQELGLEPNDVKEFHRDGALMARFFFVQDPDGYKIEVLERHGRYQ